MKVVIKKIKNKISKGVTLEQYEIITRDYDLKLNAIVKGNKVMEIK